MVALVYVYAPPTRGGTAVVLHRLLAGLGRHTVEVVTDLALRPAVAAGGEGVLDARYRWFARLRPGRLAALPLVPELVEWLNLPLALVAGVRAGVAARAARAERVLTALDGGFSNVAAALAARIARLPRTVLIFDLWEENAYRRVERLLARALERRLLRGADSVVVFCEETAEHLRRKHGVDPHVLAIPIVPPPAVDGAGTGGDVREVLVAGAVYWAQEDAVRRLLRAVPRVPGARVTMIGDEASLRARGLHADRYEPQLPADEFAARVARAGVLFLGLSHDSPHPEVIRTATPARLMEYMASGRPLLVHAPRGSHAAEYARREDFATVVDVPDDDALARGLRELLEDPERAAARAARARRLALERHDVAAVRRDLERIFDGGSKRRTRCSA